MSTAAQKRKAQAFLDDLEKTKEGAEDDMRDVLIALEYNIFVVNAGQFIETMMQLFPEIDPNTNRTLASRVWTDYRTELGTHSAKSWDTLKKDPNFNLGAEDLLRQTMNSFVSGMTNVFLTKGYDNLKKKYKSTAVKNSLKVHYKNAVPDDRLDEQVKLAGGMGSKFGTQLGHGDIGQATVSMRVERAANVAGISDWRTKAGKLLKTYERGANEIKVNVPNAQTLDIKRRLNFDGGKLRADYVHVLSSQRATSNNNDAVKEKNLLKTLKAGMTGVINEPGSITILEAVESVLFDRAAGKSKSRRKRVTGTRRKSVKSESKAQAKKSHKDTQRIRTVRSGGIDPSVIPLVATIKARTKSASGKTPSKTPLHLIGLMNKELPGKVKENMGRPRLENQTGRFAESVRLTEMISTPQGYPSIGYTYQRDPYGVHEQDSGYDPRKLIDASIREIAMQFAIGRFYTRRV